MNLTCPECGFSNPSDSRYCLKCYTPLRAPDGTLYSPPKKEPSPFEADDLVGSLVSERYRILQRLGSGGMGVVYKAEDIKLKRFIALKFLSAELTQDEEAKLRFIQEAQAASVLDHQNICTVYEIDTAPDGRMYIAMAFYEGPTLRHLIDTGPRPVQEALGIIIQVAGGLDQAHRHGIVHRDVKPANVIITPDGTAKIVDFGLAKLSTPKNLTQTTTILGTVFYISPEQARSESVDEGTDLWALGALFYELLTGRPPFWGDHEQAVIHAILNQNPVPPSELREDIPREAERIILRCLRKSRSERYGSAAQLVTDLIRLQRSLDKSADQGPATKRLSAEIKKESERRQATVLYAEIAASRDVPATFDEDISAAVDRGLQVCESVIAQYGGRSQRIAGGTFLAMFGVPADPEDAPKRAINAAITLRSRVGRLLKDGEVAVPLHVRVGVESGTVIAGISDSGALSLSGQAMNLAFELKDLASLGRVYVGPQAYRFTAQEFEYGPVPTASLKGRRDGMPLFELMSRTAKVHRPRLGAERMISSAMVGRDKEIDQLKLYVLKVINGQGSIVNVIGEAGIGKSRLMAELSREEDLKKTTFLWGRALSIGKTLSFHPLVDLFKNLAQIKEDDTPLASAQKLEKVVQDLNPDRAAELFPYIATLMGIKLAGSYLERIKATGGEALEKMIYKSLRDILAQASLLKPVVLVIEDLHWADQSTLDVLEYIFRLAEGHRILFINVFRPDYPETSARLQETVRNRYASVAADILLEPLSDGECELLIKNLLNVGGFPAPLRDLIASRAEGNPFFIEEVVRSLIDDGIVEIREGGFRVTDRVHAAVVPETIHEILMARIDKLDEETRALLKVAAVIGKSFFHKILAAMVLSTEGINDRLEYLKEVQLIKERRRLDEVEYLFKHALVQEVAYESILLKKRKELHLQAALAIEKVFADRRHEFYGMLAFHYGAGENQEKAEEYLIKAGEESLKTAASSEAIHFYQEALKLYLAKHGDRGDQETVANLEWNIAKAFYNKGRMEEAVLHFDKVMAAWGERRPRSARVARLRFLVDVVRVLRNLYLPTRKAKKLPSPRTNDRYTIIYQRGVALGITDTRRFVTDSIRYLGALHGYDLNAISNGIIIYASSSAIFSLSGISLRIAERILRYTRPFIKSEDFKNLITYKYYELLTYCMWGRWDIDLAYEDAVIDRCLQEGDLFTPPGHVYLGGLILGERGMFQEVEARLKKLQEIIDIYDNDYARSRRYALLSRFLFQRRQLLKLLPEADEGITWMKKSGQKLWMIFLLGLKAQTLILLGRLSEAESVLEEGRAMVLGEQAIAPIYASTFRNGDLQYALARLREALGTGDRGRAALWKREALRRGRAAIKNAVRSQVCLTEAQRDMGSFFWVLRKPKKALAWWARSLATAERLQARVELGRTCREIGTSLESAASPVRELNGVTAGEYLTRASAIFKELGLSG